MMVTKHTDFYCFIKISNLQSRQITYDKYRYVRTSEEMLHDLDKMVITCISQGILLDICISGNKFLTKKFFHQSGHEGVY